MLVLSNALCELLASFAMISFQAYVQKPVQEAVGLFGHTIAKRRLLESDLAQGGMFRSYPPMAFQLFSNYDSPAYAGVQNLTILPYGLYC